MIVFADYIRTQQNALHSPLIRLPFELLEMIVSYAVGASRNLIHIKHTQADHMTHRALSKFRFGQNIPGIRKLSPLPPPGFRYAVCVAKQTEDAAYAKAKSDDKAVHIHGTTKDAIERDYIRHSACLCCGEWDPNAVTEKFPFGLFTSCLELNCLANTILYTTNTFSFDDPRSFRGFLASLESRQRKMIRGLHLSRPPLDVSIRDGDRLVWSKALEPPSIRRLEGLRTLHLCLDMCISTKCLRHPYSAYTARILKDDLEPFLQLRVLPLAKVTVIISDDVTAPASKPTEGVLDGQWSGAERNKWAEQTRLKLLEICFNSEEVAINSKNEEARKDTTIRRRAKKALQQGWYDVYKI